MRKRHLCTTFKLRTNSFCCLREGLEVFIKVTSKADRWKESEKSFTKNWFLIVVFSIMSLLSKLLTPPSADKKNMFSTLRFYTNDVLSWILFQPITARLFPIAAPFPALFILMIPLDKCQMKSFENINISIKVKFFVWKTFFFDKKFWKFFFTSAE